MLPSSCPRCRDSLRLPDGVQKESVIRCPRCREEFSMREIWSSVPPVADVVSGPGSAGHPVAQTVAANQVGLNLKDEPASDFRFKDSGPLKSDTPPMARLDSSRTARRPKKAEPNVAVEFLKVAVGGVVGLAIAVLAIMWFMKRDVLKVVPNLPVQAYFLVPNELRTSEMRAYAGGPDEAPTPLADSREGDSDIRVETVAGDDRPGSTPGSGGSDDSLSAAFEESRARSGANRSSPSPEPPADDFSAIPDPTAIPAGDDPFANEDISFELPGAADPLSMPEPASQEQMELEIDPLPSADAPLAETPADVEPAEEEPAEEPQPQPTEPTPIDPEVQKMVDEASQELGPIGETLPEEEQPVPPVEEVEPVDEVDLSPPEDES